MGLEKKSQIAGILALSMTVLIGCVPTVTESQNKPKNDLRVASLDLAEPVTNTSYEGESVNLALFNKKLNKIRKRRLLSEFEPDSRLMEAAKTHALYMAKHGIFGHEFGPQTRFQKRIFAQGFYDSAGENIGVGYQDMDAAIEGWMNSSGHRRNMLKANYGLFGLAYARNVSGKNAKLDHFWVLIMGEKRDSKRMIVPFNPS